MLGRTITMQDVDSEIAVLLKRLGRKDPTTKVQQSLKLCNKLLILLLKLSTMKILSLNLTIAEPGPSTITKVCGAIQCVVVLITGWPV
ncbi:lysosomal beta glucosidase [Spatholobus suberectus]|nr:lysosomal beta glucosidase [Spatholobus suberectus]